MGNLTASKPGMRTLFRAMHPTIRLLLVLGFLESTAVIFYTSVLIPYYRSLGYGPETAGILNSVLQIASAVTFTVSGFAADRLGRKKLFTAGQLMRCVVAGSLLFTKSYLGFVLIHVFRGLSTMQSPAQDAIVAECTESSTRATSFAFVDTLHQLAGFSAPILAGTIADRYGVRVPFSIGLAVACVTVIMGLGVKEAKNKLVFENPRERSPGGATEGHPSSGGSRSLLSQIRDMFTNNRADVLYPLLAANVIAGIGNGTVNILLPFTIMDRFSDTYTAVSGIQAAASLGTMLVLLVGGRLADLHGRRRVILANLILPIAILSVFAVTSLWQMYAVILVATLVGNLSSPAIRALHLEVVSQGDRASFSGLTSGLSAVGVALGSAMAGFCYKWTPNGAWILDILMFALSGILFVLAASRHEQRVSDRQQETRPAP